LRLSWPAELRETDLGLTSRLDGRARHAPVSVEAPPSAAALRRPSDRHATAIEPREDEAIEWLTKGHPFVA
jgi:hypothetical protein